MTRSAQQTKGILCLDSEYSPTLRDQSTVEPLPELLSLEAYHRVPYVYRRVATRVELQYYLKRWRLRMYGDYPILYFALQGKLTLRRRS